ncbi:hypothetical protein HRD49_22255 [Corallococcus exiguus]|uniref:hypothetical protein n=1 Tax=Corallococcus TaxID=83461 RepID=UPI000EA14902|nr:MULTISPECIES: hypothetical protein [Corallococcus]NNB89066.1 hypothetical protein [Corallococcus exiguus]NNC06648.1 hypothetical protein [Corallococcus exiguus]NNC19664.1 hypothetical protein [Corallococcus exiguus]NPC50633.1 hypothetical protein [Corallococcus exiguus]NRD64480.1 hypothetical protein [Corallococcus exiguus]
MPATHHLAVVAVDKRGVALTVRTVTLTSGLSVRRAVVAADGARFALSGLNPGKHEVCLSFSDRPDFVLPLTFVKEADGPVPTFSHPAPFCCPTIRKTVESAKGTAKTVFTLTLTLAKVHSEVILVAGWDYSGGANNVAYCESYREDLYAGTTHRTGTKKTIPKRIDDTTVVTVFDFKSGERSRAVKSASGWFEVDRVLQGKVKTHLGKFKVAANVQKRHDDDSISIRHIYDYVSELGTRAPGALREFHIFSHAWAGGPLLVETYEDAAYETVVHRDPRDKDPRFKDFAPVNMPRLKDFRAAFAADAIVKVWGCLAVDDYRNLVRALSLVRTDTEKVTVPALDGTMTPMAAADAKKYLRNDILKFNYMSKLSAALGGRVKVYGAPPGMGANLRAIPVGKKVFNYMYVDGATYKREYDFFKKTMRLVIDDTGYLLF